MTAVLPSTSAIRRWSSHGFEIGCDNGEKVRVAFSLDCCDREVMSFQATTGGIRSEDVRDLMVAIVEHRFGRVDRLPVTANGSPTMAAATSPATLAASPARSVSSRERCRARRSNGMAEALVRTIRRDYVRVNPLPDAQTVMRQLSA